MFAGWNQTRRLHDERARCSADWEPEPRLPELSVIIPTHNRVEHVRACLLSLCRQTQPVDDYDVTVVVDGSTDGTRELLAGLPTPFRLHVIHQPRSGQHVARNRGVAASSGQYCLFLDDDIDPSPGLIAAHLELMRARSDAVGLGAMPMGLDPDADWFVRCFAEQWDARYARLKSGRRVPTWLDCYGGNLSLSRIAFEQVGGFAPDIPASHDIELGYRLQCRGLSFVYLPDAVGVHAERKTGEQLRAVLVRHGSAAVELYRRHPGVLPDILGTFWQAGRRVAISRRMLLALSVPPALLPTFARLISGEARRRQWGRFVAGYCFWYGVRRAISDPDFWRSLTQAAGEPPSRPLTHRGMT